MRFESGDLQKFERQIEDVFAKQRATKYNRHFAQSVDLPAGFGPEASDELKPDLKQVEADLRSYAGPDLFERAQRHSQYCDLDDQSSILPKIETNDLYASLQEQQQGKYGISSVDGSTMMSQRERKFRLSNARETLKAFDHIAQSKETRHNYLL